MVNKKENNKKENVYVNGQFTGVYKGDNGNMLTATHMIYEVGGDELIVAVDDGFKLLYTFLYDQYRSFQSQQKDLFAEWETIFKALGRTYNTKKSKDNVKLLEDCGLLKQIKMPNSNVRIKIVADVSLKNIRFVNPDYDAWRAEQQANNTERVAQYAAFNEAKEQAKSEAKKQAVKPVVKHVEQPEHKEPEQTVKPVEQPEQKQIEPKQPEQTEIKINTQTNWFKYREKLIEQNDKWHELNVGQQQRLMSEIVECKNSNYIVIQDVFNRFISACFYTPAKNDTIQTPKQQPSSSVVPPAIQAMNDAFNDEGFPFGDDILF